MFEHITVTIQGGWFSPSQALKQCFDTAGCQIWGCGAVLSDDAKYTTIQRAISVTKTFDSEGLDKV